MVNGSNVKEINQKLAQEESLLEEALLALQKNTGFQSELISTQQRENPAYAADALIEITVKGSPHRYIAECKSNVDRKAIIAHVGMTLSKLSEPGLLVAPYISRENAEFCREINLQFIDTHGNAYLNAPGLYVYVKGEKDLTARTHRREGRGTANATALRVIFGLLCQPTMVQSAYRDINENTGVSLGAVNSTFADLKRRGLLLDPGKARQRKLLEPKRLFEEWVTNYPIVLRPKLNPKRFSAPDPRWWQNVHAPTLSAVWGGEVAAERLTGHLKPASQTLYVEPAAMSDSLKHLVSTYRLRPDPYGAVEVLEKFWRSPPNPNNSDIAPAILAYADLIATHEPRNREAANMLWEARIETSLT